MFLDLYIAAMLHLFGAVIFKRFEERTPLRKSVFKLVFIHGVTALLAFTVGRPWTLVWIIFMFGLGLTFHFGWTLKHHIHPVTAEPRAEYYALRGWEM
jgi:formate-dependent nitrite reductase membrane component NrfD